MKIERHEFDKCVSELSYVLQYDFDDPASAAMLLRRAMIMVCWGEPSEADLQMLVHDFFPVQLVVPA